VIVVVLLFIVFLTLNYQEIINTFNRFFFEVRGGGVSKRLAQYRFALRTIPSSMKSILFGFGENAIRVDFPSSPEAYGLRNDLSIGLHNHFLGYMYAYGTFYLLGYLLIFFLTCHWLFSDGKRVTSNTSWLSKGILAGFLGVTVILLFTASLTSYKIIWVIISFAAIIPGLNEYVGH
jgi:hypothetical protein